MSVRAIEVLAFFPRVAHSTISLYPSMYPELPLLSASWTTSRWYGLNHRGALYIPFCLETLEAVQCPTWKT